MGLTAAGIGSGLDVNTIVSQLMQIESQPLTNLQQKQSSYQTQLSAYGTIKSYLSAFQSAAQALADPTTFKSYTVSSSNTSVLNATASSSAILGSHAINVTKLAATQIQAAGTGYASTTSALGLTGTLSFASGTTNISVTVAATDTLTDIQNKINSATGNSIASASIINDGSAAPNKLVITAKNSGLAGQVTITDGLSTPFAFAQTQAAADAQLTVDGIAVSQSSNTITGVLPGVTLNLQSTGATTIGVNLDTAGVTSKVQAFVDAYNKLTQTASTMRAKGGQLVGDNTLLSMQYQINSVFNRAVSIAGSTLTNLSDAGITYQKDGTLALDSTKLASALGTNFSSVVSLFSDATQGFAARVNSLATSMLDPVNGLVVSATNGINANIKTVNSRIDQMNARLTQIEANYRAQFSNLDAMLGQMQQTSSYLAQQLAALPLA
jgi:flagellar hook-associated protein 2